MKTTGAAASAAFEDFDRTPDSASVRAAVAAKVLGVTTRTVWRWADKGVLPQPVRYGGVTVWKAGDIRRVRDQGVPA